jgi:transketolase
MQSDGPTASILDVDLESAFNSFGWQTHVSDGHCIDELLEAFLRFENDSPGVLIADTIKGKGVSFMENNNQWHHARLDDVQFNKALAEVEGSGI